LEAVLHVLTTAWGRQESAAARHQAVWYPCICSSHSLAARNLSNAVLLHFTGAAP
jgi:hypothetical protein